MSILAIAGGIDVSNTVQPIITLTQPLLIKFYLLFGAVGFFYLILILVRIYYEHQHVNLLKDIRYNLNQLNRHYGLPNAGQRRGIFYRTVINIKNYLNTKIEHLKK